MTSLILTFLTSNWKFILYGLGAVFLYWQGHQWLDRIVEDRNEREEKILQLTQARDQARIEAESAKQAFKEMKRHEERLELLLREAIERQDKIRADAKAERESFEGHDLEEMATRHERWIEKLTNEATKERFDELENALNN